jgi:hypothetical protein
MRREEPQVFGLSLEAYLSAMLTCGVVADAAASCLYTWSTRREYRQPAGETIERPIAGAAPSLQALGLDTSAKPQDVEAAYNRQRAELLSGGEDLAALRLLNHNYRRAQRCVVGRTGRIAR